MKLPFTSEGFLTVFENYNQAVFPMQVVLYLLAALVVYLSARKEAWTDNVISGILTFFWLGMGIANHLVFSQQSIRRPIFLKHFLFCKVVSCCFY